MKILIAIVTTLMFAASVNTVFNIAVGDWEVGGGYIWPIIDGVACVYFILAGWIFAKL